MYRQTSIALTAAAALTLGACAADDPNRRAKQGALIGAIGGAVAGSAIGDTEGAVIGGAVGAIAGGAVGNYMDKQQRELEQELAAERAREELSIQRLSGNALKVGVASDASFDVDSASLKANARNTFTRIAEVLADYDASIIHIVGHTDSTGSADYNQALSERRASSVVNHLVSQGVNPQRLRQEGRGESEPVASNDNAGGRTKNRRVDVVIKPVVEGREDEAATPPPYLGR